MLTEFKSNQKLNLGPAPGCSNEHQLKCIYCFHLLLALFKALPLQPTPRSKHIFIASSLPSIHSTPLHPHYCSQYSVTSGLNHLVIILPPSSVDLALVLTLDIIVVLTQTLKAELVLEKIILFVPSRISYIIYQQQ